MAGGTADVAAGSRLEVASSQRSFYVLVAQSDAMHTGDVVGERFELEAEAGSGGMGAVFRARDRKTGATVALKVMHALGEAAGQRLEREAAALVGIEHPGIVRYVAHGPSWIAMEWLEGEDLEQRLLRQGLTLGESIALARCAASALGAAHARGVVHRDVKPANLWLVDGDPASVKLLDFGIARARVQASMTGIGVAIGTPAYMAPEQARGDRSLDARADVFSLGCVLFECLTGRSPFVGESIAAVLAKVLFEEVPPLGEVASVPPELEELVGKMLAKDPAPRPRDGEEVARALLGVELSAITHMRATSNRPALTGKEQRLASVVLIAPRANEIAATFDASAGPVTAVDLVEGGTLPAVRRRAEEHGARVEALADGSIVATMEGHGAPMDQAARAAACALALAAVAGSTLALATGRTLGGAGRVGEALDRAARLLRAPRPERGLRVDQVTAGLLDARFELTGDATGLILVGERERRAEVRTLLGRPTPCIGRDRELAMLEGELTHSIENETAAAVIVTAPAGTGKTRLAYEFLQRVRARETRVQVWIGRGDPVGAGSSFALAIQMVRTAASIQMGEPLEARRDKLRARVGRNLEASKAVRACDFLGEMIGTPFPDNERLSGARRDSVALGDQIRLAWVDFVEAELGAGPLLLVLDDLQWGDGATAQMANIVLDVCRDKPLMVLALGRREMNEQFPDLWAGRVPQRLTLGALPRKAAEKLVRSVLGELADPQAIERITLQAQGNAFSLEELLRAHAEGRTEVPETVLGMLEARMETEGAEARRVLRAASIFGQTFWGSAVTALLGGAATTMQVGALLTALERGEWIAPRSDSRFRGETEYAFRHPLVREAAYAMLTEEDRRLGHVLAGEWLEKAGGDALVLAEHFEKGGENARAMPWWLLAAEEALEGAALAEAIARAERGVACGAEGETLGLLRNVQAEASQWRGENARALELGEEAAALLSEGSAAWAEALSVASAAASRLGQIERIRGWAERLLVALERPESQVAVARTAAHVAAALRQDGASEIAQALFDRARALSGKWNDAELEARLAHAEAVAGDAGAYADLAERAVLAFDKAGSSRNACVARVNHGYGLTELGRFEEGSDRLRAALQEAERLGLTNVRAMAQNNLGWALVRMGCFEEAARLEDEAIRGFQEQRHRHQEGVSRMYAAVIALEMGEIERAEMQIQKALELVATTAPLRCYVLAVLAEVLDRRGDAEGALARSREAKALLDAEGAEEGEAKVRLVHAEVEHAHGDKDAAREALRAARARLLERAAKLSSPEARDSFLARVSENIRTMALAREWLAE